MTACGGFVYKPSCMVGQLRTTMLNFTKSYSELLNGYYPGVSQPRAKN